MEDPCAASRPSASNGGIESSSVLFEKAVPVRIKSPSEDRLVELTVRIIMGLSKHRRSTKVLQIQITNELDPFFLYSLEVNEDDFQGLKVEQCILVDFGTFPHKFIELLEHCIRAGAGEAPRFLAILNVRTGDSTFSVVETNQFKHLSHLSLCFRQGNDSTIKSYLAGRLAEYKGANVDLHEKLRRTLESLESSLQDVGELRSELADSKEMQSRSISELQVKHARELAREREKSLQECLEMKERLEREKAEMEYRLTQKAGQHESQVIDLDKQVRELTSTRHGLEITIAELKTKLELMHKELQERQQECDTLRTRNKSVDKELQVSSKQLNDNLIRLAALEQEVQSKSELIGNISGQLESITMTRAALESSLKDAQAAAEKAEEKAAARVAEANKANQMIEKLQAEIKSSKAKLKLKTQVTAQQETLLQERQATIEKNVAEIAALKQEIAALKIEIEASKRKEADLQKKMEESEESLKSNQQMIQWLNQQLTDAQLGKYAKYSTTSRALSLSSAISSTPSPRGPLLPSNTHNLLQLKPSISATSITSKSPSSAVAKAVTGDGGGGGGGSGSSIPGFTSKVTFKPPLAELNGKAENLCKERKFVTLELTRNGLPKPQLSFASPAVGDLPQGIPGRAKGREEELYPAGLSNGCLS
ncbi:hypothetical protein SELMODRAFT_420386 [Selaginella moellendorffii]|uniref:Spindle assembly abnormal protein 6 N-terminal domain-containing protein n=1 Tax=Selaginella moellendorffii TaxID=88036 RepID=D8SBU6_SELML|nr:spindle assembly abnormal protein 6 homolog [Selaginella moellendorffii]EFJ17985.1 hypothetical protein SELMODRAFT_420386 [Selaginella moellendorffii]|eukprot:XP_002980800.1 spindle assembly abnormal protein 6 homolog [Selaginella moellendorffii]